ncbi:hypothetical protein [Streptomyces formicae]
MNATGTAQVQALIDEAKSACLTLPPVDHLRALDEDLRSAIGSRMAIVQKQIEAMEPHTPGLYARERVLADTANALADQFVDEAPLSAAMLVAELGRRLSELATYAGEADDA